MSLLRDATVVRAGGVLRGAAVVVLVAPCEIDMATADGFSRSVEAACATCRRGARVVVDLSAVSFCDSSALRVLERATRAAAASGCALEVRRPPASLRRMAALLAVGDPCGLPTGRPRSRGRPRGTPGP